MSAERIDPTSITQRMVMGLHWRILTTSFVWSSKIKSGCIICTCHMHPATPKGPLLSTHVGCEETPSNFSWSWWGCFQTKIILLTNREKVNYASYQLKLESFHPFDRCKLPCCGRSPNRLMKPVLIDLELLSVHSPGKSGKSSKSLKTALERLKNDCD